jgi:MFS family permease
VQLAVSEAAVKRTGPARLSRRWALVLTLSLTETVSWGVLYYAFSVFIRPMQVSFGWSRASITGAFSLAVLLSAIVGLPLGRWLDRRGSWLVMVAGSSAAAVLVLGWAAVGNLAALYAVWAGIGVVMAAVLYEPAFAVIATAFPDRRADALTLLTFLGGFASVIFLPLAGWLVIDLGWRSALVVLAGLLAIVTLPLHLLVLPRRRDDAVTVAPAARAVGAGEAVRGATFRWLTAAFCLTVFASSAITVHLVPYLIDRGYNPAFAATTAGLVGVAALPGRLIFTPLGDRMPRAGVTAVIFLLQAAGIAVLVGVGGLGGVIAFVLLFGAGFGAVTPARAAMVADTYGPTAYASISGVMMLFVTGARALGPLVAGVVHDRAGGYTAVFWALAVLSLGSAAAVSLVDRRPCQAATVVVGKYRL